MKSIRGLFGTFYLHDLGRDPDLHPENGESEQS